MFTFRPIYILSSQEAFDEIRYTAVREYSSLHEFN
jgi:hypothetical protein